MGTTLKQLLLTGVVLAGFSLLLVVWLWVYAVTPVHFATVSSTDADGGPQSVIIPGHTGLLGIQRILAERGVVNDDPRFFLLALVTGRRGRLQAGEYLLPDRMTPRQILEILAAGRVYYRPVTIPEGADLNQIAGILDVGGWVDPVRFKQLCREPTLLRELGIDADSLEGYLFPDTYFLSHGRQDAAGIIRMMAAKGQEVFDEIVSSLPGASDLSRHEILTLASIIEKETGRDEERPLVAGVFINRLRKDMRLQADPTVIYGLQEQFHGVLSTRDLKEPSPYNTYINKGLPPGPICCPGRAAIVAVLQPAGDYLFFVAKNDGTHQFSRTLAEHNKAVAAYRAGL